MKTRKLQRKIQIPLTVVLAGGEDEPHQLGVYHVRFVAYKLTPEVKRAAIIRSIMQAYGITNRQATLKLLSEKFDAVIFDGHLFAHHD